MEITDSISENLTDSDLESTGVNWLIFTTNEKFIYGNWNGIRHC